MKVYRKQDIFDIPASVASLQNMLSMLMQADYCASFY